MYPKNSLSLNKLIFYDYYVKSYYRYHYYILKIKKNGCGTFSFTKKIFYYITIIEIMLIKYLKIINFTMVINIPVPIANIIFNIPGPKY